MKNIYSITTFLLFILSISLFGQTRIYPPELRFPGDGFEDRNPDIVLDWDAVTGQTPYLTYEAQLAILEDFSDAVTFPRTDVTSQKTEDLIFGQTYFWRVRAFDDDLASDWSETWAFEIVNSVNIESPKDGNEVYADPKIVWSEITGLTSYELQYDTTYVWNAVNTGTTENINATFIVDENNMWIVGDNGLVQYFDGTNWSAVDVGTTENLYAISFVNETTGYVVGENGVILSYESGVWSVNTSLIDESLYGVSFSDIDNGWAVGPDSVMIRYMNGNWTIMPTLFEEELSGVFTLAPDNAWACGEDDIILHFDGTDWTSEIVGSKDFLSIWFNDANNGWASSKGGKIQYYNGSEWVNQVSGTTKDLLSISMTGQTGFAVGKSGTMVVYENDSWKLTTSGISTTLNAIFVKGDLGLSGGDEGVVISKSGTGFDSPFNSVVMIPGDSTNFELSNMPYASKIYYRMRSMHSVDTSVWSEARTMITYPSPKLDKPKDTTSNVELFKLFKCKEYSGSTNYYFQISENEEFVDPYEVIVDSISTNYTMNKFGHKYFWRVKASHKDDISNWSDVWWLETTDLVELDLPINGAKDVITCPRYEWEEMLGVSDYEIYVDSDPDFSDPTMNIVDESFYQCQQPMTKKTTYYWKVRAITSQDTSSWSDTWSFETEGYADIEDELSLNGLSIYPNPNNGSFMLSVNSLAHDKVVISVTDLAGKSVYNDEMICIVGENTKEVKLYNQRNGLYLISVRKGNSVITKKLFIN